MDTSEKFLARSHSFLLPLIQEKIKYYSTPSLEEEFFKEARLSVVFETSDSLIEPIGYENHRSQFGGPPSVPHDFEYPLTRAGHHWIFLGQICLNEIAMYQNYLPRKGMLSFFVKETDQEMTAHIDREYPLEKTVKVFYFDKEPHELMWYNFPSDVKFSSPTFDNIEIEGYRAFPRLAASIPYYSFLSQKLDHSTSEKYFWIMEELIGKEDPRLVHGVNLHEQRAHRLINCDRFAEKVGEKGEDLIPLMYFSQDPKLNFSYGAGDGIGFYIRKKDLEICDFSSVLASYALL